MNIILNPGGSHLFDNNFRKIFPPQNAFHLKMIGNTRENRRVIATGGVVMGYVSNPFCWW